MKNVVFFGSSAFSIPSLQTLIEYCAMSNEQYRVSCVITTKDKPAGRHLKLTPNPLKQFALDKNIKIYETTEHCALSTEHCIGLVAAYGKIIPQSILDTFNNQLFNIHPSLLPKYRGPSPLQFQILDGLTETGVTVIQIDAQMDHGPIVAQEKDVILDTDTPETLGKRLFIKGTVLFIKCVLSTEHCALLPQIDSEATYTRKLTRQDGFISYVQYQKYLHLGTCDLDLPRMIRAFAGWPGLWTTDLQGNRIKIS